MARTKKRAKLTPTKPNTRNPYEREDEETRALRCLKYKCMPIRWKREKKKKKKKKTYTALQNTTTGTRKKREHHHQEEEEENKENDDEKKRVKR
jgi:hypothetical protein